MPTIRLWHGCKVLAVIDVSESGCSLVTGVGGAENGARPTIELDPFRGLIVSEGNPTPVAYGKVTE